jgi:DNA-binding response OmpR family regulator
MRVLLGVENKKIAKAIQGPLQSQKYVVDWVRDGEETWQHLSHPDLYSLVILDWKLPQLSGLELCLKLRQKSDSTPLLLLTPSQDMHDRITGLDSGADDCLSEPFGLEELLARIRALLRRPRQIQAKILCIDNISLDCRSLMLSGPNHEAQFLTAKEFQLLEYLMSYSNQVLTHDQIRDRLWGLTYEPMSNVIAAKVRSLRRKFEHIGCHDSIETVRGLGYRFNSK